ncbi:hypothetical protein ACFQRB_16185 [Halobaculum litoreum]|uniref:Uncharacterized protein n=1 Tax=Halobaculum litoreum TaxID=3031998 RepID=A0ABD5XVS4_9EURY
MLLDDTAGVLGDGVPEARVVHDGLKLAIPTDDMVHRAVAAGVARGLVVPQAESASSSTASNSVARSSASIDSHSAHRRP